MSSGLEPAGEVPSSDLGILAAGEDDPLVRATLGWLDAQRSANTEKAYRRDVTGTRADGKPIVMAVPAWLAWCDQERLHPLRARRSDIDRYSALFAAAGQSPATWARKVSAVSSWYDYLLSEDITDKNPAKKATRPNIDRDVSPAVGLSEAELDRLIDEAEKDGHRSHALICVMFFGAFRLGSVLAADVGDLVWDQGVRALEMTLKGGKKRRTVLEDEASQALNAYLTARGSTRPGEPLFATSAGKRLDQPYCWRLVRRLARQAGIPSWDHLNPHSLRHTHATHARDHGVALDVVQGTLGHVDQRTTLRYDRARHLRNNRSGTVLSERRRALKEQRQREAGND